MGHEMCPACIAKLDEATDTRPMHNARTSLLSRLRSRQTMASLLLALATSCQGEDTSGLPPSVCPMCMPQTGGDSGDFPGHTAGSEVAACTLTLEHVPVSDDEATALGFNAAEIRRRLARSIDAPLIWREDNLHGGQPANGYQVETRMQAAITATGFVNVRNDPRYCDGTTCRLPDTGESVPQAACIPYLEVPITVTFKTLDGAVSGTAKGRALRSGTGSSGSETERDWFPAEAFADLHDVVGSLQLFPAAADRGQKGYLSVWLQLYADQTTGDLRPMIKEWRPGEVIVGYEPLVGYFPPPDPMAAPPQVDAGVRKRDDASSGGAR